MFCFPLIIILHITMYRVSYVPLTPFSRKFAHRAFTVRRIFQEINQHEWRGFAVISLPESTVIPRSFCDLLWVQLLDFKFQ